MPTSPEVYASVSEKKNNNNLHEGISAMPSTPQEQIDVIKYEKNEKLNEKESEINGKTVEPTDNCSFDNNCNISINPPAYISSTISKGAPLLIGKYEIKEEHIMLSGKWGMTSAAFGENGLTSSFEMKAPLNSFRTMSALQGTHPSLGGNVLNIAKSGENNYDPSKISPIFYDVLSSDSPKTNFPRNGIFDGHFFIQSLRGKPQSISEKGVKIYFFYDIKNPLIFRVEGTGQNKFGVFNLYGYYEAKTSTLFLYKVYQPKVPKIKTRPRPPSKKKPNREALSRLDLPSTPRFEKVKAQTTKSIETSEATDPRSSPAAHPTESAPSRFRSERKRVIPAHLREDALTDLESTKVPMRLRRCWNSLKVIMINQMAVPFLEPVDPVRLNIPDYLKIIKAPMDLSTVKRNIECGSYENPMEYAKDVRLTFTNAMVYNKPDHLVHVWAKKLLEIFNKKFAVIEKEYKKKIDSSSKPSAEEGSVKVESSEQLVKGSRSKSLSKRLSKSKRRGSKSSEIEMMKQQIEQMKQQIQLMHQTGTPKAGKNRLPLDWDVNQPMTFDEKKELSQNINLLPQEKLGKVLEIIHERVPFKNGPDGDGEIEIDINSFDTPTLRILQQYVVNALSTSKRKRTTKKKNKRVNHLELAESVGRATSKQIETVESQLKQLQDSPTLTTIRKSPVKKQKLSKNDSLAAAEEISSSSGSSSESSSESDSDSDSSDDGYSLQKSPALSSIPSLTAHRSASITKSMDSDLPRNASASPADCEATLPEVTSIPTIPSISYKDQGSTEPVKVENRGAWSMFASSSKTETTSSSYHSSSIVVEESKSSLWVAARSQEQLKKQREEEIAAQQHRLIEARKKENAMKLEELEQQKKERENAEKQRQHDARKAEAQREKRRAAERAKREDDERDVDMDEQGLSMSSMEAEFGSSSSFMS